MLEITEVFKLLWTVQVAATQDRTSTLISLILALYPSTNKKGVPVMSLTTHHSTEIVRIQGCGLFLFLSSGGGKADEEEHEERAVGHSGVCRMAVLRPTGSQLQSAAHLLKTTSNGMPQRQC